MKKLINSPTDITTL